jgi:hypothetical protein
VPCASEVEPTNHWVPLVRSSKSKPMFSYCVAPVCYLYILLWTSKSECSEQ